MRRREFIAAIGSAAAAWPLAARAQQASVPVVGFLHLTSAESNVARIEAFRQGLKEAGYTEGGNVAIEYRWAEGHRDGLPRLAADLIARQVAVIATGGGPDVALAVKAATAAIPIVFVSGDDPVRHGLVASLNRPGGNVTGVAFFSVGLAAKRLQMLRELLPAAHAVGYVINPANSEAAAEIREAEAAAAPLGLTLHVLRATTAEEIDAAFAQSHERGVRALAIASDPFLFRWRDRLVELAARHRIPFLATGREYVAAGGLASYGTNTVDAFRQSGAYVARILRGEKPADLPVTQPTKFELAVNLKTAKALGIAISDRVMALADEVIE
jgi:putative ABC transport system substrate-binding protein